MGFGQKLNTLFRYVTHALEGFTETTSSRVTGIDPYFHTGRIHIDQKTTVMYRLKAYPEFSSDRCKISMLVSGHGGFTPPAISIPLTPFPPEEAGATVIKLGDFTKDETREKLAAFEDGVSIDKLFPEMVSDAVFNRILMGEEKHGILKPDTYVKWYEAPHHTSLITRGYN